MVPWFPGYLAAWLPGCLAPWLLAGSLAPWLLGCLASWLPGSRVVPRDPPDPRTWLPGLAPGRPERAPREDPADPGPGGRKRTGLQPQAVWGGGRRGTQAWPGVEPRRGDFRPPSPYYKALALKPLAPGPRSRTQNPGSRSEGSRYPGFSSGVSRYTGLAKEP